MKTRKLVLIIANIFLLAVVITQGLLLSRDGSKNFRLKENPDEIIIKSGNDNIVLKFTDNKWVVGEKKYDTNMFTVDSIINSITNIRCLEKVGSVNKQGALEKYELTDNKKISVIARKNGVDLRTVEIGKNATTGSQNFVIVDGGKDIYLATGSLRNTFSVTESGIRSDVVWDFDASGINSVNITTTKNGEVYSVTKSGSGEDLKWTVSGTDIDLDSGKAQSWFDSLGYVSTSLWYDENDNLGGEKISTVRISHDGKVTSIEIYEVPPVGEETIPSYYGKSSETPYPFQLTSYTMEKINKNPEELAK